MVFFGTMLWLNIKMTELLSAILKGLFDGCAEI